MTTTIKTSETRLVRRSQINKNPANPKRHSDEAVKLQRRNIQKVGYLGGIVWNSATHNIIDGHRRLEAYDILQKYDGTQETDYDIKVEVVTFDTKTEREQLAYMAAGDTKFDIDLLAKNLGDVDFSEIGLSSREIDEIAALNRPTDNVAEDLSSFLDNVTPVPFSPIREDEFRKPQGEQEAATQQPTKSYEERKQEMKDLKQAVRDKAAERERNENSYITLSFSSYKTKEDFCDLLGIKTDDLFAKGEDVLKLIE